MHLRPFGWESASSGRSHESDYLFLRKSRHRFQRSVRNAQRGVGTRRQATQLHLGVQRRRNLERLRRKILFYWLVLCVFCGATIAPPQRGARVINLKTLDDLANLRESVEVECKLAAGADGKGRLPREFWPTYSAFANTRGGVIVLGLREDAGHFSLHGIEDADRIVNDLFNTANNPEKVSVNLLDDNHAVVMPPPAERLILPRADTVSGSAEAQPARTRSR